MKYGVFSGSFGRQIWIVRQIRADGYDNSFETGYLSLKISMKFLMLCILSLVVVQSWADAGFNITRKKKTCIIRITGTQNLSLGKLVYRTGYYQKASDDRPYANKGQLIEEDFETMIQEGSRRWKESDRNVDFILVDKLTGATIDSLHLFAKDHSYTIKITGESSGHLQYSIDSTKAIYRYALMKEEDDTMAYSRNRMIFIACSVVGFILLAGLFFLRKRKAENKVTWA